MKETPILFTTENIPKILDGSKTMTRRLMKLHDYNREPDKWNIRTGVNCWFADSVERNKYNLPAQQIYIKCPYGGVGDRLYVKEAFWIHHDSEWNEYSGKLMDCGINIAEDNWAEVRYCATDTEPSESDIPMSVYSKVSPLFMPKWAARIWEEITSLRLERLRQITLADAIAEGYSSVEEFIEEFLRINHLPEDADPWVWVIGTKLL